MAGNKLEGQKSIYFTVLLHPLSLFFSLGSGLLLRLCCVLSLHLRDGALCVELPDVPSAAIWIQIQVQSR